MARKLRIAVLAPIATAVDRGSGESIEELAWLHTEELLRRGHEVTLYATGDSRTSARLRSVYRRGYDRDDALWDWQLHEMLHAAAAFESAEEFDLVHSHAYHFTLPFTRLADVAVVHSYHVEMDQDVARAYRRYPEVHVIAASRSQAGGFEGLPRVSIIPHGIDFDAFPFNPDPGGQLVFLGRMIEDKGPAEAVAVARRLGMPLTLAGPPEDYFEPHVERLVDGELVRYEGRVSERRRNELLAGAGALLYPIKCPEPFGLVLVEAMACGTPVVALDVGAVPEIVKQGVTGRIAGSLESMAGATLAALDLDRRRVREEATRRFDYRRMVDNFEWLYEEVLQERRGAS